MSRQKMHVSAFPFLPFFIAAMLLVHGCNIGGNEKPAASNPPPAPAPPVQEVESEERTEVMETAVEYNSEETIVTWKMNEKLITEEVSGYKITIATATRAGKTTPVLEGYCNKRDCNRHPFYKKLSRGDYQVQVVPQVSETQLVVGASMSAGFKVPWRRKDRRQATSAITVTRYQDGAKTRVEWTLDENMGKISAIRYFRIKITTAEQAELVADAVCGFRICRSTALEQRLDDGFYRIEIVAHDDKRKEMTRTKMTAGFELKVKNKMSGGVSDA